MENMLTFLKKHYLIVMGVVISLIVSTVLAVTNLSAFFQMLISGLLGCAFAMVYIWIKSKETMEEIETTETLETDQ